MKKNLAIFGANHPVPGIYNLFRHTSGECSPGLPCATSELTSQSIMWTNSPGHGLLAAIIPAAHVGEESICKHIYQQMTK